MLFISASLHYSYKETYTPNNMINYRDDNGACISRDSAPSQDLVFDRPIYIRFRLSVPPYSKLSDSQYRMRFHKPIGGNGIKYKAEIFIQADSNYAEQCRDDIEPDATRDIVTGSYSTSHVYFFNLGTSFQKFVNSSNWLNVDYVTIKLTPAENNAKVLTVKGGLYFQEHFTSGNIN